MTQLLITELHYGMKLSIPVNPIQYVIGGVGISSSDTQVFEEFVVDKYWDNDIDPNVFKVKCVPTDKSGRIGYEKFYSSDLINMINRGTVKIIECKS